MMRQYLIAATVALALASIPAMSRAQSTGFVLGSAIAPAQAERSIVIGPDTRWANVQQGESIRFVAGQREFAWRFDGSAMSFDLLRVAPTDFLSRSLRVYVAQSGGRRSN